MMIQNGRTISMRLVATGMVAIAGLALAGCSGGGKNTRDVPLINLGTNDKVAGTVNRYLWAASLETVDFLPIDSADPISGLILTDWYVNPEAEAERFKVNVYILDAALRADALRVSVFRQTRDGNGSWVDAAINPATPREIENAILTRARQLRLNTLDD